MITFKGMPQSLADALRSGATDAYGLPAERMLSDGQGNPCRCCLNTIPKNVPMLVLAYKPFTADQPYAETGPVFLCADPCKASDGAFPAVLQDSPDYLLKAYSANERIIYGTGKITASENIASYAAQLLSNPEVAFVDVRSSRNNCWQARILRS